MVLGCRFAFFACVAAIFFSHCLADHSDEENGLLILTVATEQTDGFLRFMRSAQKYKLNVQVLGMGEKWEGGEVIRYPGGGQKVNLLTHALEKLKNQTGRLIMFVDSYDVIFTDGEAEILRLFNKMDARVVFSAEHFCWPDITLSDKYPPVKVTEARFLNSGGFIGYAPELYKIVTSSSKVKPNEDDQLFYTNLFLNKKLREEYSWKLDSRSEIFQCLNGALDELTLKFKGSSSYLYNSKTGNIPIVVHGNGPSKLHLNSLSNYLSNQWTPTAGCQGCKEGTINLEGVKPDDLPQVLIGIFFEQPTPFADMFFDFISKLDYPKSKIDLFVHCAVDFHQRHLDTFMSTHGLAYHSATVYKPSHNLKPRAARNRALEECLKRDCLYYLSVDGVAHLENDQTLRHLIEHNRSVVAPLLVRKGENVWWSNFWGAVSSDGYYQRSEDYLDIVQGNKVGIWNVPYITAAYLLHRSHVPAMIGGFHQSNMDHDMAICQHMRKKGVFMHVDNQASYGILVNSDNFDTSHLHNDLYEIFNNPYSWEKKYIHSEYHKALAPETVNPQPCPDVYWFPFVTMKFCDDYVEEVEHYGQWSGGKNQDVRLAGGYENVPTVDIHTNQIGWEQHWLQILKTYIAPLSLKVFLGYYTESRAIMNFVVRYRPGEQDRLRPHHDSSTFTVNLALNHAGIDFEGGGPRYIRYNCSLPNTQKGWLLMHPGRLTHLHEGMPVTKGTRYIMVSFVDP